MCPVCLTTAALVAAGTGATAGLAGLLFARRRPDRPATSAPPATKPEEK